MEATVRERRRRGLKVALLTALALLGSTAGFADRAAAARKVCAGRVPTGGSERAAEATIARFLRTAVVQPRRGSCGTSLAVAGLAPARYPTRRPGKLSGWYQLAPRIKNTRGYWEYAGFLYVDAPDAAPAAFEFLLELHGRRWLVSRFAVAPGSTEVDFKNAPT